MRKLILLAALALVTGLMALQYSPAQADDFTCAGPLPVVMNFEGNVIVPAGGSCFLNPGSTVHGNVKIEPTGSFTAIRSEIKGDIQSDGARSFRLNGVVVGGSVQLKKTTGPSQSARNFICNASQIDGDVEIVESGPGSPWDIGGIGRGLCDPPFHGNVIRGNLKLEKNEGNLHISLNRVLLSPLFDGRVRGNLQAFGNTGGVQIELNDIDGNLQCKDNVPPPTGFGNTVRGNKEDQCSVGF